jgi:Leucine-rich repeat (LRR) protein
VRPRIPWPRILAEGGAIVLVVGCGGKPAIPAPLGPPRVDVPDARPAVGAAPVTVVVPVQVLEPIEPCDDYSDDAIATFEDADLEIAIRSELSVDALEPLTCGLVAGVTYLNPRSTDVESLLGIQNLRSLTQLGLSNNSITDLSPLGGLASLTSLRLSRNPDLSNIQALLDNASLGEVSLLGTKVSCSDVVLLERNGVFVFSACH